MERTRGSILFLLIVAGVTGGTLPARARAQTGRPILFVTRTPYGKDFETVNTVFGNHLAETCNAPRGGDLYIRYADGTLRNLTAEAGYGVLPGQEIAVREPSVHWSGSKALFSMVIGGTNPSDTTPVYWQIYEVTGIGPADPVQITKLPQPADSSNVSPLYGTDDRIIFNSDRPRNGNRLTYPELDEYEAVATVTGLWSMNPDGTDLKLLDHAPSGNFTPIIASDGRMVFTRWDHLQRDQLNNEGQGTLGAFNFVSETSTQTLATNAEVFPELRVRPAGSFFHGHIFNLFFPWEMNEDGSALETLNHVGRHELLSAFPSASNSLPAFVGPANRPAATIFLQMREDPCVPGYFYGTSAPEFGTHAAGQIMALFGAPNVNADDMQFEEITDPITATPLPEGQTPPAGHPGHFRNPLPLSDCTLVAVRTTVPYADKIESTPLSARYDLHLTGLLRTGQYFTPTGRLIPGGIVKSVSYVDRCSGSPLSYSGPMWEMDPVEIVARAVPARRSVPLPSIEMNILNQELGGQAGVDQLKTFLQKNLLALIVSRNVTRRADRQQEFNLKIANSSTQTADPGATPVDIQYLQFYQADLIRGYQQSRIGRRPLAQPLHDGLLPPLPGAPAGAVQLGADGSMAAFVPARRALSWQLVAQNGAAVARERYWVTFAPGEMRTCANCHGINRTDTVLHQPPPTNPPQALTDLAIWWRTNFAGTATATPAPGAPTATPSETATMAPAATLTPTATPTLAAGTPTTATFCVDDPADDGFVTGGGASYPPPATSAESNLKVILIKRSKAASPVYQVRVALARFPTGGLPDAIHVTGARLTGRLVTVANPESRALVCEFYDAGNWPIDNGDYTATPPSPSARACQMPLAVGVFGVDLDPVLADQGINRVGDTGLRFHMSDNPPLPPNANSNAEIEAWETGGANALCLSVTYVPLVSATPTLTSTLTSSPVPTSTPTPAATLTAASTATETAAPTAPPTLTSTPLPTSTPPPAATQTATSTTTETETAAPTAPPTLTFTPPATSTATLVPTDSPTPAAVTARFCVDEAADDGYVTGSGSTYPPPGTSADPGLKVIPFKRSKTGNPPYQVRVALARFPTGGLPDAIRITAAQLTGRIATLANPEHRALVCEFYDASHWPIDLGDYAATPPVAAARACQLPLAIGVFSVDLDPTMADQNINRVGDTGLRLHMDDSAPLPPNANNNGEIEAWENGGANPLCLTVTYVPM